MKISLEPSTGLISNLHSTFLRVSPNCRWCHHTSISIMALLQHHQHWICILRVHYAAKRVKQSFKNMKRYSLAYPMFLEIDINAQSSLFSSLCEKTVSLEARVRCTNTATMMYYERVLCWLKSQLFIITLRHASIP